MRVLQCSNATTPSLRVQGKSTPADPRGPHTRHGPGSFFSRTPRNGCGMGTFLEIGNAIYE
jgi:hypothetical protein